MEDINNNILLNSSDRYFKDKISPSTSTSDNDGTCNLKLITLLRRDEASSDPFVTVKHDPAVLEAFVTIDKNEMKEDAGSSSYMDNEKETVLTTNKSDEALKTGFDDIVASVETSLRSLTPEKLKLLMDYARILRLQRELNQRQMECAFCKKNGKLPSWYTGHVLRDQSGRVQCPVLRGIRCPRCSATGDRAHTIKYCPESLSQQAKLIDVKRF